MSMCGLSCTDMLVVACTLLLLCSSVNGDAFETADTNSNNNLSREEFAAWTANVKGSMQPYLDVEGSAASGGVGADATFVAATFNSLLMIVATEIGDKTFFIAAVLAMRHGRLVVYAGAMGALGVMHVLSCVMGYALPALFPRVYTHYLSVALFVYFGYRLCADAATMGNGPSEELQEVEQELISKKDEGESSAADVESGDGDGSKDEKYRAAQAYSGMDTAQLKVLTQSFMLTFLAEWGDRSQIATIALASTKNVYGVIVGGLVGHAFCTGMAVMGGRMLAQSISERTVAYVGGSLFFLFALHAIYVGPDAM